MKFLRYLASKKTEYLINIGLFTAGSSCLVLGVNEQTSAFAYFAFGFFYLLVRRLEILESFIIGFFAGAIYGYASFFWLAVFADITPFYMAMFFNSFLLAVIFSLSAFFFRRFPKSLFIHLFSFGFILFIIRAGFHYSPVLPYAKAFLTYTNTPTVFDWLTPYLGSSIIDVLVLSTGCLLAQICLKYKNGGLPKQLIGYIVFFMVIVIINSAMNLKNDSPTGRETVRVALLQGNFNWEWDKRVTKADDMFDYYSEQTVLAAAKGSKIVVWPEYAVPRDILKVDMYLSEKLVALSHTTDASIVTGSLEFVDPTRGDYKNKYDLSLVYDPVKTLLEPYRAVHPLFKHTVSGTKKVVFSTQNSSFPVISCFEVANHGFVLDYLSKEVEQVDFLIAIANIQIFENNEGSTRIANHIRRLAMESGKYFVYVSNTGPSFVLDPHGKFKLYVPVSKRSTQFYDVPKIKEASVYSKFQDIPLLLIFAASLGAIFVQSRNRR